MIAKLIKIMLQLLNRSILHPRRIIEDIIVKVDKFIFWVNFAILDLDEKVEVPLIRGKLFLAIYLALIDVKDGRMVLRVGEEKVMFKHQERMRHSMNFDDSCYFVKNTNECVIEFLQDSLWKDNLESVLMEEPPKRSIKKKQ